MQVFPQISHHRRQQMGVPLGRIFRLTNPSPSQPGLIPQPNPTQSNPTQPWLNSRLDVATRVGMSQRPVFLFIALAGACSILI